MSYWHRHAKIIAPRIIYIALTAARYSPASTADLPEGAEATQLTAEIKNNPEWLQQACETLSCRLGKLYMSLAETWIQKGQPQQAALYLDRVIKSFPGSREAQAARLRVAGPIQGRSTWQAEFKKP